MFLDSRREDKRFWTEKKFKNMAQSMGSDVLASVTIKNSFFRVATPRSPLKMKLKMKAICSSETSVDFQQTARHYIPEDRTLRGTVKL
jgi:hypothetical protein